MFSLHQCMCCAMPSVHSTKQMNDMLLQCALARVVAYQSKRSGAQGRTFAFVNTLPVRLVPFLNIAPTWSQCA